jgi:hypothetical protein
VGRVEIPAKKWISKSSFPVPEKTRGVLNNIPDNLVKVRGSGVKVRFWTPFWQGNWRSYGKSAQPSRGNPIFH